MGTWLFAGIGYYAPRQKKDNYLLWCTWKLYEVFGTHWQEVNSVSGLNTSQSVDLCHWGCSSVLPGQPRTRWTQSSHLRMWRCQSNWLNSASRPLFLSSSCFLLSSPRFPGKSARDGLSRCERGGNLCFSSWCPLQCHSRGPCFSQATQWRCSWQFQHSGPSIIDVMKQVCDPELTTAKWAFVSVLDMGLAKVEHLPRSVDFSFSSRVLSVALGNSDSSSRIAHTPIGFSHMLMQAARSIPKSTICQSIPSLTYSSCSITNLNIAIYWYHTYCFRE